LIFKTPVHNYYETDDFEFDGEGYNLDHSTSELEDMEDNNDNIE